MYYRHVCPTPNPVAEFLSECHFTPFLLPMKVFPFRPHFSKDHTFEFVHCRPDGVSLLGALPSDPQCSTASSTVLLSVVFRRPFSGHASPYHYVFKYVPLFECFSFQYPLSIVLHSYIHAYSIYSHDPVVVCYIAFLCLCQCNVPNAHIQVSNSLPFSSFSTPHIHINYVKCNYSCSIHIANVGQMKIDKGAKYIPCILSIGYITQRTL